jgi:hypothetical protein
VTNPELTASEKAEAALSCEAFADAVKLAAWVGPSRELTTSGVLRPASAVEACQALGIALASGRLRSAMDVPELERAWAAALAADLVRVAGKRASTAPVAAEIAAAAAGAGQLGPELADQVLLAWLRAVSEQLGFPDDVCGQCLAMLVELAKADGPAEIAEVTAAVLSEVADDPEHRGTYVCPDCGQPHERSLPDIPGLDAAAGLREVDLVGHALTTIDVLTDFGAVSTGPGRAPGGTAALTALGRLFAWSAVESISPAADETAGELAEIVADYPPVIALAASARWLAARTPSAAAGELLGFAAAVDRPLLRSVALTLARQLGPEALPAWREFAVCAGVGAYARQHLASQGEEVKPDSRDEAWLLVDSIVAASGELPWLAELAFSGVFCAMGGEATPELLADLESCGHPNAGQVAALFAPGPKTTAAPRSPAAIPARPGPSAANGKLCQLLITMRYVDDPPVWRRVLVPAGITLGQLHHVIQDAMGWEHSHLHMFTAGKATYGVPDGDFMSDDQDENAVRLSDLLSRKGQKISYTYDIGDYWDHLVQLEKSLLAGSAEALAAGPVPVCLAGEGACPPEDCGGAGGYAELKEALADPDHDDHEDMLEWLCLDDPADFSPAEFDLAEVNRRLRG